MNKLIRMMIMHIECSCCWTHCYYNGCGLSGAKSGEGQYLGVRGTDELDGVALPLRLDSH